MPKYNIDDILSDLGVPKSKDTPAKTGKKPGDEGPRRHRIDQEEESFSPLPPMPANQRLYGEEAQRIADPAVKRAPSAAPKSAVGRALNEIYTPETDASAPSGGAVQIGDLLVSRGIITAQQLTTAQSVVRQTPGKRIEDVIIEQGVEEEKVLPVVAELAGVPFERIDLNKGLEGGFDGRLLQRLGFDYCKAKSVIPLRTEGMRIIVGSPRPNDIFLLDEVRTRLHATSVKLVMVTNADIRGALDIVGAGQSKEEDLAEILSNVDEADVQVEKMEVQTTDLEKEASESPVIRTVNYIIQTAQRDGASDIHIEPSEKKLKVRFRIDGELFEMMNPPPGMASAIISRLKIMANLDIAERRIPQDGRVRCTVQGRKLDLRMSTLPTNGGEKVVLRILDTKAINVQLEDLGFHDDTLVVWKKLVDAPHGIVLVTGPTGSGKTTTLYSSLRQLDKNSMNISTVEDPIEYHLDGITQTQVHEKIGMNFATALRALLRQDPDVIMVGEIRDMETAQIAVQAALTGHLVLSTLHTNDAPSSLTRLVNIGLEPFLVGAAVNGVLAQRLVRRLCNHCKAQEKPGEELATFLEMQGLDSGLTWVAKGCEKCRQTGFSGRVGIYELLTTDDQLRDVIARNPNVAEFRRTCIERGMVTLRGDGMRKVGAGITTVHEILRVTEANA
ncbi:MAG: Flp pilus assembly complex ATPase component TadA [Phycisphaeraceae bacterium]|nr:Flp pilus assembly complex ATPase component TadA [Phycisphaeraceae bacterium]